MEKEDINFIELQEELSSDEKELILGKYIQGKDPEVIASEVNRKSILVKNYVKSYEKARKNEITIPGKTELEKTKDDLRKEINIVDNLHFVMDKLKKLVSQLEVTDENGDMKVNTLVLKPYLESLKNFTDVTQWMADRRIKLEDMIENQIYKQALMEELRNENKEFADRVWLRIQALKLKKDLLS